MAAGPQDSTIAWSRITVDPLVMGGRACIRGIRITVSQVVNLVASGMTFEEILREYPELEEQDVREALRYAAWLASEEVHSLGTGVDGA